MADIDQIIAGGAGAGTTADFSGIPKLLDSYWAGKDQAAKNDLREAFKGGVPTNPDGSLDIPSVMKTLFQKGDIAGGVGLAGASMGAQDRAALADVDRSQAQQPANYGPPSANRAIPIAGNAPVRAAPAGTAATPQARGPQGDQPGSIVGMISAAGIPDELAGPYIAQISAMTKTDPNTALDPQTSSRVQQVVQAAAQRMKGGQQPQPSGLAPQPQAPQQQPQMAQAPQTAPQGFQPSPAQQAAQNDPILRRLTFLAASQDKSTAAAAKVRLESYLKNQESTTEMKNAAASSMGLPAYQEKQGELAAQQAGATENAKAYVTKYNNIDEAGTKAIQEIPKLQLALKQMDSPDFQSGSGQRFDLAYRRLAVRLGGDPDKAAPQEIVSKVIADSVLNGLGSLKGLGPIRVAEMNLARTAAMSMDNSPQTNRFLANVAIRIQQRAVEVSDMAQNYNDGVLDVGFDKKLREMDKNKPLFTPDEVQRFQKIIDGKEKQSPQQGTAKQGPSSSPTFGSKADVHAAIASGKLKKGDSFIAGDGVERTVP